MRQDESPAVPLHLTQSAPTFTRTNIRSARITAAVAGDSYWFPFGRPHEAIRHVIHRCAHTIRNSLDASSTCVLFSIIGFFTIFDCLLLYHHAPPVSTKIYDHWQDLK